ncbi:MAG: PAS domain S-box protein, partial [Spirochaetota bacterium]
MKGIYNYEDIVLIDSKGRIKWSASGITRIVAEEELRAAALSAKAGKPVLTDFYRYPMSRHIHCSVVAFMQDQTGASSASLILLTSATEFLYPLIQSWPVPSASAETLLVERQGDQVLFLNEPRFRKGSALDFLVPLSRVETPAVQAVTGRKGVYEGSDYRGIPCISFLAKVPETPWFIVSKMDVAEVFRPTRGQVWLLAAFIGALVAQALSIGLIVIIRSRRSQAEMSNLRLRQDLQESVIAAEARYHRMIDGVTDYAILSLDARGRVATWNIGAQRTYGYEASEILGELFSCFYTDEEGASGMPGEVLRKAVSEGRAPDEGWRIRKGGSRFWSLDNVTPIIDGYGRLHGYTVITRDLTEHILAEDRLRRMTAFYQLQSKASQIIVNATDEAELFDRIVMACVEYGHLELAWIGVPDEAGRKIQVAAAEGPERAYVDGLAISLDRDQETGQ